MNLKYIWSSVMDYINNTLTGQIVDFYHINFGFITALAIVICFLVMFVFVVKVVANKDIYTQKDIAVKGGIGILFFIFTYIVVKSFVVGGENIYFLNLYLLGENAVSNNEYGKSHYGDGDFVKTDRIVDIKGERYYYDVRETMISNIDILYKTKSNISDLDIYKKYKNTTDLEAGLKELLKTSEYGFSGSIIAKYTETDGKYTTFLLKDGEKYYIIPVFLTNKMLSVPTLGTKSIYSNTSTTTETTINDGVKDNYIFKSFTSIYPSGDVGNEEFNNIEKYYISNGNSFKENTEYKNKITNNISMIEKYKDNEKVRMYIFYLVQLLRNKDVNEQNKIKQNMYTYFGKTNGDEIKSIIDAEIGADSNLNIFLPITVIESIFPGVIQVSTSGIVVGSPYNLTIKEEKIVSLLKEMETKGDLKGLIFSNGKVAGDLTNEQKFKSYISRVLGVNLDEIGNGLITTTSSGEGAGVICVHKEKVSKIFSKYGYEFDAILNCGNKDIKNFYPNAKIKNLEGFEKIIQNMTKTAMIDFKKNKIDFSYFVMNSTLCGVKEGSSANGVLYCRILLGDGSSLISPFWLYEKVANMETDEVDNVAINLYDMQNQFISTKDKIYRWNFFVDNSFFKKVYNTNYISYSDLGIWSVIDPLLFLLLKGFNYVISVFGLLCIVYFYKKLI